MAGLLLLSVKGSAMPQVRALRPLNEGGRTYKLGDVFEVPDGRAQRLQEITPPLVELYFPTDQPLPLVIDPTARADDPKSGGGALDAEQSEPHPSGDALSLDAFRASGKRRKQAWAK